MAMACCGSVWLFIVLSVPVFGEAHLRCLVIDYFAPPLYHRNDGLLAHLFYLVYSACKILCSCVCSFVYAKDHIFYRLFLIIAPLINAKVVAKTKALLCDVPPAPEVAVD